MKPTTAIGVISALAMLTSIHTLPPTTVSAQDAWVCDAYDQTAKRERGLEPGPGGRTFPIVTIHGITGSDQDFDRTIDKSYVGANPQPPRSLLDALAGSDTPGQVVPPGLPGARVYSFSYTPDSLRWVDYPNVGGRFAATIDCLYELHGMPVSVVAHSMGGLVARWVANTVDTEGVARSEKFGKIITLGTPYEGSLLSSIANGATDLAAMASPAVSLLNWLCGSVSTESGSGDCGPVPLYGSFRSTAGRNLQVGSTALAALEPWPDGLDVSTLAGAQIVPLNLFGATLSPSIDIGDIAVQTSSATADPRRGRVFECRYGTAKDSIRTELLEILSLADPRDRQAKLTGAFLASPCYHGNLTRYVELTNEVLGLLNDWLTDHAGAGGPGCDSWAPAVTNAYERAAGVAPSSVEVRACTQSWVLADIARPDTDDTDGLNLFRGTHDVAELVGDVVPACAEELTRLGVPDSELASLGLPSCPDVTGSGWPTDDHEGPPAFFALQGATAQIAAWSSCSDDYCIGGLDDEIGVWGLRGVKFLGTLPASTEDPLQRLIAVGFDEVEARLLLTPGAP